MYKWNWFAKYAGWYALLIAIWLVILFSGCAINKTHNLLYEEEYKNLAYKSVTEKDYKDNDDEC